MSNKCTVIKTGATVTKTPSSRVEELKNLIASINIPLVAANAGDIAFYDDKKEKVIIVAYSDWSADPSLYPSDRYTPVGVVAVPRSHDVYGTGECAVVSLKNMSCETPDEGSLAAAAGILWGQYDVDTELPNMDMTVLIGTPEEQTEEASGEDRNGWLPSDYFSENKPACLTDPVAHYYNGEDNVASPSPYLADGSRNPVYYQTTAPTSEANALSDFGGPHNSNVLLSLATAQEDWQTAETIENESGEGFSPAACCCWRYHTDGTNQGDWYLPAFGELGYLMVRYKTINNTINALIEEYGESVASAIATGSLWSSTERLPAYARDIHPVQGAATDGRKGSTRLLVRAFLRV